MTRNPREPAKFVAAIHLLLLLAVDEVYLEKSHRDGELGSEYPKGCSFLRCGRNEQCVIRRFWCKNPPCPSMLYCSKSRKESLGGPETCDQVRCSHGYVCHVRVRHCRWERCEQQRARCIAEREYYEGPASCAGFRCPSGRRCILRESFCIRPPCKLLKSCARHNDARLWFDRCRNLGCPSEHECFLRRPDGRCSHPPCKHTPDCTTVNEFAEAEPSWNEQCRGWICPKREECRAQVQGPCDSKGETCRVKRYCHAVAIASANSSRHHVRFNSPATSEEGRVPVAMTLADIERQLILKDQEALRDDLSRYATTTLRTKGVTKMTVGQVEDVAENTVDSADPKNQWVTKWRTLEDDSPTYIAATGKPIGTNAIETSSRSPLDKIMPALTSTSAWLDHIRRRIGIDAIRVWAGEAEEGRNYEQFQGWLQSVKEILGPTIYELWLEDVRAATAENAAFQAWLLPDATLSSAPDLQRLLEHDLYDKNDSRAKRPGARLNAPLVLPEGRYSIHDRWDILRNPAAFNSSLSAKHAIDSRFLSEDAAERRNVPEVEDVGDYYYGRKATKADELGDRLGSLEKSIARYYPAAITRYPASYARNSPDYRLSQHEAPPPTLDSDGNDVARFIKQMFGYGVDPSASWLAGTPKPIESAALLGTATRADNADADVEPIKLFRLSFRTEYDPWQEGLFRSAAVDENRAHRDDELIGTRREGYEKERAKHWIEWRPRYRSFRRYPAHAPPLFRASRGAWRQRRSRSRDSGDEWTGARNLFTPHRKLPISLYGVLRRGPAEDPRSAGYPLFYAYTPDDLVDEEFRLLAPYAAHYHDYLPRADDYVEYYERFHADTDGGRPLARPVVREDALDRPGADAARIVAPLPDERLQYWQAHHRNLLAALLRLLDKERYYHYGADAERTRTMENGERKYQTVEHVPENISSKGSRTAMEIGRAVNARDPNDPNRTKAAERVDGSYEPTAETLLSGGKSASEREKTFAGIDERGPSAEDAERDDVSRLTKRAPAANPSHGGLPRDNESNVYADNEGHRDRPTSRPVPAHALTGAGPPHSKAPPGPGPFRAKVTTAAPRPNSVYTRTTSEAIREEVGNVFNNDDENYYSRFDYGTEEDETVRRDDTRESVDCVVDYGVTCS